MRRNIRPAVCLLLAVLALLSLAPFGAATASFGSADIPKINYVKGTVLSEEPMEVDPARASRGLSATLIKAKVTSGPDAGQEVIIVNRKMGTFFLQHYGQTGR